MQREVLFSFLGDVGKGSSGEGIDIDNSTYN